MDFVVCKVYLGITIKTYTWLSFYIQILMIWLYKTMCIENLLMYTHTLRWVRTNTHVNHLGSFLGSEKPLGSGEIDGAKMSLSQGRQLLISLTNPVIMGAQCLVTLIRREWESGAGGPAARSERKRRLICCKVWQRGSWKKKKRRLVFGSSLEISMKTA